jgi:hypothetical protein
MLGVASAPGQARQRREGAATVSSNGFFLCPIDPVIYLLRSRYTIGPLANPDGTFVSCQAVWGVLITFRLGR